MNKMSSDMRRPVPDVKIPDSEPFCCDTVANEILAGIVIY